MKAGHFSPDVGELIETLGRHGVRYLLVGGEAVIYHGYPRLTGDVDFFYEQTSDNATRLFAALEEFWGGSVPAVASARELLEPGIVVQLPSIASPARRRSARVSTIRTSSPSWTSVSRPACRSS